MNNKKKLIAGNWKMNGSLAANEALVEEQRRLRTASYLEKSGVEPERR